jgi:iron(III) transport system ATP-binding protein
LTVTSSPEVVIEDLHKGFGDQPVLRGLQLVVPAGSFTAVLGTSGSGKTTLLRIIAGYERPDRGSVAVGATVLDNHRVHVRPERRHIGYVSQEGTLFPHLSVAQNIGFGLPRRQRRGSQVADLLDAVGLAGLGERYPHQLSGGQQQRVALARSLAVGSEVVLLDEPFNTLDANLRSSVRSDVHDILRQAGATGILVTHDQDEALSMADLIAVIRGGTIAQVAAPGEIYDNPVDADLARFVGDANVTTGTTTGQAVETAFGLLALREGPLLVPCGPVTVMFRPEQVQLEQGAHGPGVLARVLSAEFHGSGTVISMEPQLRGIRSPIVARVLGNLSFLTGSTVRFSVNGPVCVWPSTPPDQDAQRSSERPPRDRGQPVGDER